MCTIEKGQKLHLLKLEWQQREQIQVPIHTNWQAFLSAYQEWSNGACHGQEHFHSNNIYIGVFSGEFSTVYLVSKEIKV